MYESNFQRKVKKDIRERFPGCYILKTDPNDIQGIPDLLVLYEDKWAALEVKKSKSATHRPNQDYHVNTLNGMSYSTFIFPENEEEVLNELSTIFSQARGACAV